MKIMEGTTAVSGSQQNRNRIWSALEQHPVRFLTFLYLLCILAFLASTRLHHVDGHLTGSDGTYYYSYLPSLILDHDLDFRNQYEVLISGREDAKLHASEGRPPNKYTIGAAVLWTPFFLIGHLLALALRAAGFPIPLDGMGFTYQIPTMLGSITYGFAGVLLLHRSCCRFFSRRASAFSSVLIWLATNLIYYMIAEPSMSHACSFFAASLFLNLWLSYRPDPTLYQWLLLGLSGGLIALVRPPDATWLALPAIDLVLTAGTGWKGRLLRSIRGLIVFGIAAAIFFLPQFLIWQGLDATPTMHGRSSAARYNVHLHWFSPDVLPLLFSLSHGLFSWHPVLLFAAAGLFLLYRKNRSLAVSLTLVFASQVYMISSWYGWPGGHSFGSRMLISSLPALAFGLAALLEWTAGRRASAAIFLPAVAFVVWNALFFVQYRFGYIPKLRAITFHEMTVGKFTMLKDLPSRLQSMLR